MVYDFLADPFKKTNRVCTIMDFPVSADEALKIARFFSTEIMDHGSDISGVRGQNGSLSDAMEAVLAAVYLDGGFERARDVVNRLWPDQASLAEDAKSRLQEMIQSKGGQAPTYQLIREEGPDHARVFTVRVNLDGGRFAEAQGQSKKKAEQAAAERMLASLEGYTGQ